MKKQLSELVKQYPLTNILQAMAEAYSELTNEDEVSSAKAKMYAEHSKLLKSAVKFADTAEREHTKKLWDDSM